MVRLQPFPELVADDVTAIRSVSAVYSNFSRVGFLITWIFMQIALLENAFSTPINRVL